MHKETQIHRDLIAKIPQSGNKKFLAGISILLNLYVCLQIYLDKYSHLLIFFWLFSITILILSTTEVNLSNWNKLRRLKLSKKNIFLLFFMLLPVLVRLINFDLTRIHTDDLITAYFSAHYNLSQINFFSMIPPDKGGWVSQFPTVYFALQKNFFLVLGENLLTVKLSILPYVLIVSLFLFLMVKKIFNDQAAIISLIIYSFMAVSLYHETLGLHFISSTAAFMAFFYFALLNFKKPGAIKATITGLACGSCYLFYTSSYIAFPILVCFFLFKLLLKRQINLFKNFFLSVLAFLILLSPFITYMYRAKNFYFRQRFDQVNLIGGEWSGAKDQIKKGQETIFSSLKKNTLLSLKSFYQDGIGGHGGYDFGHLAFFEKLSLILFIAGSLIGLFLIFKKIDLLFLFATIFISYITGIVLTIPPPAFHRFSIAFPFIAIVCSLPFYLISKMNKIPWRRYLIVIFLILYAVLNQAYFQKATMTEKNNSQLLLANYISKHYSGRNLYIAAFPGFALEKIFYFTDIKNAKDIKTEYHDTALLGLNSGEKYVYVVLWPESFANKFQKKDKNGRIIKWSHDVALFVN